MYRANWGDLPFDASKPEERLLWDQLVGSIPYEAVDRVVEKLYEVSPNRKPRYGAVRQTLRRLGYMRLRKADGPPPSAGPCAYCEDTGWMTVLAAKDWDGERRLILWPKATKHLYEFVLPCKCSRGEKNELSWSGSEESLKKWREAAEDQYRKLSEEASRRGKESISWVRTQLRIESWEDLRVPKEKAGDMGLELTVENDGIPF
ncbi:MAG: hypothetical protein DRO01_05275 [Thermoproteota archaeon]|nr:MAG: hypothetical protein DRO01_05275 [Candidatus Korarchaeota archaeon]